MLGAPGVILTPGAYQVFSRPRIPNVLLRRHFSPTEMNTVHHSTGRNYSHVVSKKIFVIL